MRILRRVYLGMGLLTTLLMPFSPNFALFGPVASPAGQEIEFAVPSASEPWKTRLLHPYRTTMRLPSSWHFYEGNHTFYDLDWQWGLLLRLPPNDEPYGANALGRPLAELCEAAAQRVFTKYEITFQHIGTGKGLDANADPTHPTVPIGALEPTEPTACLIESPEQPWAQAVIRLPEPHEIGDRGPVDILWWFAHRDVLPALIRTISFAPPSETLYVSEALRILEENYIFAEEVDWAAARRDTLTELNAESSNDNPDDSGGDYPYVNAHRALARVFRDYLMPLDNAHSQFLTPAANLADLEGLGLGRGYQAIDLEPTGERLVTLVYPDGPADRAGLQAGDLLVRVNGQTIPDFLAAAQAQPLVPVPETLTFEVQRPGEADTFVVDFSRGQFDATLPVQGRRLRGGIGYLEAFSVGALDTEASIAYATDAHRVIETLDTPAACEWIVDLRRNTGGSVLPMALAVAPLWGEGEFLRPRDVTGIVHPQRYADGQVFDEQSPRAADTIVEDPYAVHNPTAPVAILISRLTASMGEVTARAIINRPDAVARTFGEQTRGWDVTLLGRLTLYDQARMDYSSAVLLDPKGIPIREPIQPDVELPIDYSTYGTDEDPLIQVAQGWLHEQPECRETNGSA